MNSLEESGFGAASMAGARYSIIRWFWSVKTGLAARALPWCNSLKRSIWHAAEAENGDVFNSFFHNF
jgi:hypothetical protein